jgi:hypothetical protein
MTRSNAVWRLPLMADGSVSKTGLAIQLSGGVAGPDGIEMDGGGGPDARKLGQAMADTWVQFVRYGDPNHSGIPKWDAYSDEAGVNLVFDNRIHTAQHPDRVELQAIRQGG